MFWFGTQFPFHKIKYFQFDLYWTIDLHFKLFFHNWWLSLFDCSPFGWRFQLVTLIKYSILTISLVNFFTWIVKYLAQIYTLSWTKRRQIVNWVALQSFFEIYVYGSVLNTSWKVSNVKKNETFTPFVLELLTIQFVLMCCLIAFILVPFVD